MTKPRFSLTSTFPAREKKLIREADRIYVFDKKKEDTATIEDVCDELVGDKIKNSKIHSAHICGDRSSQEDADTHFECEYFKFFSSAERKRILISACKQINDKCLTFAAIDGACANFTISWLEDIPGSSNKKLMLYTVNAGDVSSFCAIEQKNEITRVERINPSLHLASEVKNQPGFATVITSSGTCRLRNGLMMYRCFGNRDYGCGHSGEVEVTEKEIIIKPGDKPYILLGCDGLTEIVSYIKSHLSKLISTQFDMVIPYLKNLLSIDPLLKVWQENKSESETLLLKQSMENYIKLTLQIALAEAKKPSSDEKNQNIAWHLVNIAYCLSNDNISAKITNPLTTAICMGMLDGHGGRLCADFASRSFQEALLNEAYNLSLLKAQQLVKNKTVDAKQVDPVMLSMNKLLSYEDVDDEFFQLQQSLKKICVININSGNLALLSQEIGFFFLFQMEKLSKKNQKILHHLIDIVDEPRVENKTEKKRF